MRKILAIIIVTLACAGCESSSTVSNSSSSTAQPVSADNSRVAENYTSSVVDEFVRFHEDSCSRLTATVGADEIGERGGGAIADDLASDLNRLTVELHDEIDDIDPGPFESQHDALLKSIGNGDEIEDGYNAWRSATGAGSDTFLRMRREACGF